MTKPYIGITGVVTPADVATIASCVALLPPSHRLMAGVLVSAKTLRGEQATSRRYPHASQVDTLLTACADAGAWPVVHYNTRAEGEVLGFELALLSSRLFPAMRGLQLNVVRPDVAVVREFASRHPAVEVIVQVNRAAIGDANGPVPAHAAIYASAYVGAAHALIDLSGGTGAAVDVSFAARVTRAWRVLSAAFEDHPNGPPRLGVAGGLGPDAGAILAVLRAEADPGSFAALSFGAESGVRSPVADPTPGEKHQDALDAEKARAWVRVAADAVTSAAVARSGDA